jgi:excisionase family DNA binding protein
MKVTTLTGRAPRTASITVGHGHGNDVVFSPDDLGPLVYLAPAVRGIPSRACLSAPTASRSHFRPRSTVFYARWSRSCGRGRPSWSPPQGLILTTEEAADFLGISRPTLIERREDGAIPFEKPNRHRRVLFQDLIDFQQRHQSERWALLDQLTEEAD